MGLQVFAMYFDIEIEVSPDKPNQEKLREVARARALALPRAGRGDWSGFSVPLRLSALPASATGSGSAWATLNRDLGSGAGGARSRQPSARPWPPITTPTLRTTATWRSYAAEQADAAGCTRCAEVMYGGDFPADTPGSKATRYKGQARHLFSASTEPARV